MNIEQQIQRAARLVGQARTIVAMTGAGISTPSGIPDFRSADSGLWDNVDPLSVASIHAFRQNPEGFYKWIHPLARLLAEAEPNPAHYALANLEAQAKLTAVITQNPQQRPLNTAKRPFRFRQTATPPSPPDPPQSAAPTPPAPPPPAVAVIQN